jgi:hypothetical protein
MDILACSLSWGGGGGGGFSCCRFPPSKQGSIAGLYRTASPPPLTEKAQPLLPRAAHGRARRCQSEAPSRHTNHPRPRITPGDGYADYGRLVDEDYRMCGDGGTHNKENQLVLPPSAAADLSGSLDKENTSHRTLCSINFYNDIQYSTRKILHVLFRIDSMPILCHPSYGVRV